MASFSIGLSYLYEWVDRIVTMIHLATIAELIDDDVEVGVGLV